MEDKLIKLAFQSGYAHAMEKHAIDLKTFFKLFGSRTAGYGREWWKRISGKELNALRSKSLEGLDDIAKQKIQQQILDAQRRTLDTRVGTGLAALSTALLGSTAYSIGKKSTKNKLLEEQRKNKALMARGFFDRIMNTPVS